MVVPNCVVPSPGASSRVCQPSWRGAGLCACQPEELLCRSTRVVILAEQIVGSQGPARLRAVRPETQQAIQRRLGLAQWCGRLVGVVDVEIQIRPHQLDQCATEAGIEGHRSSQHDRGALQLDRIPASLEQFVTPKVRVVRRQVLGCLLFEGLLLRRVERDVERAGHLGRDA